MKRIKKHVLTIGLLFLVFAVNAQSVTVNWNNEQQTIDGFGACDAWLSDEMEDHAKSQEIMDIFFKSGSGIELSILRQKITHGVYEGPGQWDWNDGSFTSSSWVANEAKSRGVDKIWGACWSPPAWMKTNNDVKNGGYLESDKYDDHAEFLSEWVKRMKDYEGIEYYAISPQNEPGPKSWASMEWNVSDYRYFLDDHLVPTMNSKGLGDVKIMYPEVTGWGNMDNWTLDHTDVQDNVDILCGHNYWNNNYEDHTGHNKPVWHTEWWVEGGVSGMDAGLILAENMHKYFVLAGVKAWHYWWLATPHSNKINGLIHLSSTTDYQILKNFYITGQFSKFIKPGWKRIDVSNHNPTSNVWISAYKNANDDKVTIVAINKNTSSKNVTLNFNGFSTGAISRTRTKPSEDMNDLSSISGGGSVSVTLDAESVTTFYADATPGSGNPVPSTDYDFIDNLGNANDRNRLHGNHTNVVDMGGQTWTGDWVKWRMIDAGGGYYYIELKGENKRLQANSDNTLELVAISTSGDWVEWEPVSAGNDYYYLENKGANKRLKANTDKSVEMVSNTSTGDNVKWFIHAMPAAPANSTIKIFAAGKDNTENMELKIDGTTVQSWNNIGGDASAQNFVTYTYTHNTTVSASQVQVHFTNDLGNTRDLRVDKIEIDGVTHQTEAPSTYSVGAWDSTNGCAAGFKEKEWNHCGGYFQYDCSNCRIGSVSNARDLNTTRNLQVYPNPSDDVLNVNLPEKYNGYLKLYTTTGKKVLHQELKGKANMVELSSLNVGIYILEINTGEWSVMKKIIRE